MNKKLDDLINKYNDILNRNFVNSSSYFEWNTYRIFEKLGGYLSIERNFVIDKAGFPISHAKPGVEDFFVEYKEFFLLVECSLRSGVTQVDYEGNSVIRHLKNKQNKTKKNCYALFLAPKIDLNLYKYYYIYKKTSPVLPLNIQQFSVFVKSLQGKMNSLYFLNFINSIINYNTSMNKIETWVNHISKNIH